MKYRIKLIETVGDYFQEEWNEDYDTIEEAHSRIMKVNSERSLDHDVMAVEMIEGVE